MVAELDQLLEMGFTKSKAEKALKLSGNRGLEAAMEWLVEHQGDEEEPGGTDSEVMNAEKSDNSVAEPIARCNKILRNDGEIQFHSARTGHVNFSESSEEVKPLTEEEKKMQLEKIQELLKVKTMERQEKEKQTELEREKQRRQQGRTLGSAKAKFEEEEMRRIVDQKKREKDEDRAYREKLKAEIAREREEKKCRQQGLSCTKNQTPLPIPTSTPVTSESSVCRLQIRLPNGTPVRSEFGASEPLSAVALYISQHCQDSPDGIDPKSIRLLTSFPSREFSEDDLNSPLSTLGLCPSATIIARYKPF